MEGILNFNEPLNVELLDKVVNTFYQGYGQRGKKGEFVSRVIINSLQNSKKMLKMF